MTADQIKIVYISTGVVILLSGSLLIMKQNLGALMTALVAVALLIILLIPAHTQLSVGTPPGQEAPKPPQQTQQPQQPEERQIPLQQPASGAPVAEKGVDWDDISDVEVYTSDSSPPNIRNLIRNEGLYGVHGDLSCERMKRGAVADKRFLEPLKARNQMLDFLEVDQLRAKDAFLIPRNIKKLEE